MRSRKYAAFISYSHAADGKLAPALQAALQRFAKPWYQTRALRVFRDETGLEVTPALWPAIERALEQSDYFILLASPQAAQSRWVQQEVNWWLKHRSSERLLIAWTDGQLSWGTGDFDWASTNALPQALRGVFHEVPNYSDLCFAKRATDLSLRNARFLMQVARFSSVLRRRSLDELIGEDVREHQRTKRLAWSAASALIVLTLWAFLVAALALYEKHIATRQRQIALEQTEQTRQRAVQILDSTGQRFADEGDPSAALVWFLEALRLEAGHPEGELRQRVRLGSGLRQHPSLRNVWSDHLATAEPLRIRFSPDSMCLLATGGTNARLWSLESGTEVGCPPLAHAAVLDAVFKDQAPLLLTAGPDGRDCVWDAKDRKELLCLEPSEPLTCAGFSDDAARVLTVSEDNTLRILTTASGRELLSLPLNEAVQAASFGADGNHVLTQSGGKTVRVWGPDHTHQRAAEEHQKGLGPAQPGLTVGAYAR